MGWIPRRSAAVGWSISGPVPDEDDELVPEVVELEFVLELLVWFVVVPPVVVVELPLVLDEPVWVPFLFPFVV